MYLGKFHHIVLFYFILCLSLAFSHEMHSVQCSVYIQRVQEVEESVLHLLVLSGKSKEQEPPVYHTHPHRSRGRGKDTARARAIKENIVLY